MANAYMGITPKFLSSIDTKFRDVAINAGMSPDIAANIFNGLSRTSTIFYLAGSLPYYLANIVQAGHGFMLLGNAAGDIKVRFGKDVSVVRALADDFPNKKLVMEEASKMGAIDPTQMEHMLSLDIASGNALVKLASIPSTLIEKGTRKLAFINGYKAAIQVMSHQEALKYAAEYTDKVSVPYSQRAGAPLLFGEVPDILRPLTMFLTFQQHQLGLLNNGIQLTKAAYRGKNYGAMSKVIGSMLAVQAFNMSLFGLGGLAFSQPYDVLAYLWDLPGVKELGRTFDRKFFDDIMKSMGKEGSNLAAMGALSEFTGYDLSGSGSGVSINVSTAFPRFIQMAWQGMLLSGRAGLGNIDSRWKPTDKEIWEWANTLPQNVRGVVEYLLRHDKAEFMRRVGKDINLPLDGYRTTTEQNMRLMFGVLSTKERQQQLDESIYNTHEQKIKEKVARYDQLIKENKFNSQEFNEVVQELYELTGQSPATVVNIYKEYEKQKAMTQEQRKFKNGSLGGLMPYQRFQKFQEQGGQ